MPETITIGHAILFALLATRLLTMMMIAPVYGSRALPIRFRLLIGLVIALLLMPFHVNALHDFLGERTLHSITIASLFMSEIAIGLMFGLSTRMLFVGVGLAGQQFASMCGTRFPGQPDSMTGSTAAPVSQLFSLVCLLIFLGIGGHRKLLSGLLDSFRYAPPGKDHLSQEMLPLAVQMLSSSFEFALRIGAPIVIATLLALLLLGIASRGLPQFHLMESSFTINSVITLVIMIAIIGSVHSLIEGHHDRLHDWIAEWLEHAQVARAS